MILVDTSIWIDHLRTGDAHLVRLLGEGAVLAHPFVSGELALGNLPKRDVVLGTLLWTRDNVSAGQQHPTGYCRKNDALSQ